MEPWQQELKECLTGADELAKLLPIDRDAVARVSTRYPLRIPRYYLGLIDNVDDPIWQQAIPAAAELHADRQLCCDPLAEAHFSPVPGLVHRHPDRALLLVSASCPLNCRFCFRKNRIADGELQFRFSDLQRAIDYLQQVPELREVILTGGEPLMLSDLLLEQLLKQIAGLPQQPLIRIHSRVPAVLPSRVTEHLAKLLRRYQPLHLVTHFNHPLELSPQARQACAVLADTGIPLANQCVLLKGVNDSVEVLEELLLGLLRSRIHPYYLHQLDLAAGTGHFRTPLSRGMDLCDSLRTRVPGLALPQFVVDLPGGAGKLPLQRERLVPGSDGLQLRALNGELIAYPDLQN